MPFRFTCISVLTLLACSASASLAQRIYTITDIGTLPGGSSSTGRAINNKGEVTGAATTDKGLNHAFLYRQGKITDLGALPNYPESFGQAINDAGQVTGFAYVLRNGDLVDHAFLASGGTMTDLGTLPGGQASSGQAINSKGQIVGQGVLGNGQTHALWMHDGQMTDLNDRIEPTSGWVLTVATGINAQGQIVGTGVFDGTTHAFLLTGKTLRNLGTVPGSRQSAAQGINVKGEVIGALVLKNREQAFLYDGQAILDLDNSIDGISSGLSINSHGVAVGDGGTSIQTSHAVLYSKGEVFDLNGLIDPKSGWILREARSINDAGQIVGSGFHNGQPRAFILTPPSSSPIRPSVTPPKKRVKKKS